MTEMARERIAELEAEVKALRAEVEHWRAAHLRQARTGREERYGAWPVGIEQPHPVGERPRPKPREVFDDASPWAAGSGIRPAPTPPQLCTTCATKVARGETAVCGCIMSGPTVTC